MKEVKSKYKIYDPTHVSSPFGLNNNGAICWFNSVTQFLLGLPSFNSVMTERKEELEHNELAAEYIRTLEGLLPNTPEMEPITPAEFAGVSGRLLGAMLKAAEGSTALGYGQQCASEGFTTFLQTLKSTEIDNLFCNAFNQVIVCTRCGVEVSSVRDTANRINVPPTKNFANDDEQSKWRVYTAGLPFSHPHRYVIKNFRNESDFHNWIMRHAAITLDFTCPKCSHRMPMVIRGETLSMLREVIVVSFDMIDRIDPTWFPQELSFPTRDGTTLKYRICGKICWSGNVNRLPDGRIASGGHYWAHSLRESQWYCLNDGGVSPGNSNPEPSTFMIAYHLMSEE
jgi:Ubiquitin carboxyl-terminal hydrolase